MTANKNEMGNGFDFLDWTMLALFITLIFWLIRKIFEGNWGFQELIIALLAANLGYSIKISLQVSKLDSEISCHLGWHKGRESHVK